MESFSEAFRQATERLKVADYAVTKIVHMSKDPKVVSSAIKSVHEAQVRAIDALLLFERTYKRVPAYPVGHLETKLRLFSEYCVKRYKMSEDMVKDIRQVAEWVKASQSRDLSLSSDSRLLLRDGFDVTSIPLSSVKAMVSRTEGFLDSVNKVVQHAGSN